MICYKTFAGYSASGWWNQVEVSVNSLSSLLRLTGSQQQCMDWPGSHFNVKNRMKQDRTEDCLVSYQKQRSLCERVHTWDLVIDFIRVLKWSIGTRCYCLISICRSLTDCAWVRLPKQLDIFVKAWMREANPICRFGRKPCKDLLKLHTPSMGCARFDSFKEDQMLEPWWV